MAAEISLAPTAGDGIKWCLTILGFGFMIFGAISWLMKSKRGGGGIALFSERLIMAINALTQSNKQQTEVLSKIRDELLKNNANK